MGSAIQMALVFTAAAMTMQGEAEDPVDLRVMSFNVRYATAPDGQNAWEHRKDILINAIRYEAPDIIGTQECLEVQAEYIAESLPEYRWFGVGREADGTGEHGVILYRHDLLAPIKTGNFWLSETPDVPGSMSWETACTRMVTWARFHHLPTGRMFHVFNTHFDHRSEEARLQSAQMLRRRVDTIEGPVVVLGDFNAKGGDSAPWSILTEGDLDDAWDIADETIGPSHTFCRFEPPQPDHDNRIDWILVRRPITVTRCETMTYNEDGRYPSDHFPVVADLGL